MERLMSEVRMILFLRKCWRKFFLFSRKWVEYLIFYIIVNIFCSELYCCSELGTRGNGCGNLTPF